MDSRDTTVAFTLVLLVAAELAFSQPNCEIFKSKGDTKCYEACVLASEAEARQGYRDSQEKFDKAIALCPTLDYAYFEKSVPYLKRGDFVTWKKLIDQAVALNSWHLGYRGWCRYQFLRDYRGAIEDFEKLQKVTPGEIGYSQNGDYQLNIVKALCYSALGEKSKAIQIIETQFKQKNYSPMAYDYLHLGVIKLDVGDLDGSIDALKKSISANDYLAENYYYLGMAHVKKDENKQAREYFEKALEFYRKGYKLSDVYTHPMDKIYLSQIENALSNNQVK